MVYCRLSKRPRPPRCLRSAQSRAQREASARDDRAHPRRWGHLSQGIPGRGDLRRAQDPGRLRARPRDPGLRGAGRRGRGVQHEQDTLPFGGADPGSRRQRDGAGRRCEQRLCQLLRRRPGPEGRRGAGLPRGQPGGSRGRGDPGLQHRRHRGRAAYGAHQAERQQHQAFCGRRPRFRPSHHDHGYPSEGDGGVGGGRRPEDRPGRGWRRVRG